MSHHTEATLADYHQGDASQLLQWGRDALRKRRAERQRERWSHATVWAGENAPAAPEHAQRFSLQFQRRDYIPGLSCCNDISGSSCVEDKRSVGELKEVLSALQARLAQMKVMDANNDEEFERRRELLTRHVRELNDRARRHSSSNIGSSQATQHISLRDRSDVHYYYYYYANEQLQRQCAALMRGVTMVKEGEPALRDTLKAILAMCSGSIARKLNRDHELLCGSGHNGLEKNIATDNDSVCHVAPLPCVNELLHSHDANHGGTWLGATDEKNAARHRPIAMGEEDKSESIELVASAVRDSLVAIAAFQSHLNEAADAHTQSQAEAMHTLDARHADVTRAFVEAQAEQSVVIREAARLREEQAALRSELSRFRRRRTRHHQLEHLIDEEETRAGMLEKALASAKALADAQRQEVAGLLSQVQEGWAVHSAAAEVEGEARLQRALAAEETASVAAQVQRAREALQQRYAAVWTSSQRVDDALKQLDRAGEEQRSALLTQIRDMYPASSDKSDACVEREDISIAKVNGEPEERLHHINVVSVSRIAELQEELAALQEEERSVRTACAAAKVEREATQHALHDAETRVVELRSRKATAEKVLADTLRH